MQGHLRKLSKKTSVPYKGAWQAVPMPEVVSNRVVVSVCSRLLSMVGPEGTLQQLIDRNPQMRPEKTAALPKPCCALLRRN